MLRFRHFKILSVMAMSITLWSTHTITPENRLQVNQLHQTTWLHDWDAWRIGRHYDILYMSVLLMGEKNHTTINSIISESGLLWPPKPHNDSSALQHYTLRQAGSHSCMMDIPYINSCMYLHMPPMDYWVMSVSQSVSTSVTGRSTQTMAPEFRLQLIRLAGWSHYCSIIMYIQCIM